jgi:hypothetical protein
MGTNDVGGYGYIKSSYVNSSQTARALLLYAGTDKAVSVESGDTVINDDSLDRDLRVESNAESHAIFVDAGNDRLGLFSSSPTAGYKVSVGGGAFNVIDDNAINRITSTAGYTVNTGGTGNIFRLATMSAHGARARARAVGSIGYGDPVVHEFTIEMAIGNQDNEFGVNVYRTGDPINQHRFKQTNAEFDVYTDKVNDSSFDVWVKMGHFTRLEFFLEAESGTTARFDNSGTSTLPGTAVDTNTKSEYLMFADDVRITTQNTAQTDLKQNVNFNFDGAVFNENSNDLDFRVESDGNTHMLFVDGGNNAVGIGGAPLTTSQLTLTATSNTNIVLDGESYSTWVQDAEWNSLLLGGAYYDSGAKFAVTNRGASQINIGHDGNATPSLQGFIFSSASAGGSAGTTPPFENLASITRAGTVFNEDSYDRDFRVESDSNANMLTVDAGGNSVLIGTSTVKTARALYIETSTYPQQNYATNASVNYPVLQLRTAYATGGQTATQIDFRNGADTEVGTIKSTVNSTAYNTSSDQRLKDNIVDAPSASDDIDAIQVRSFDWKANGLHQKYGMVAQELLSIAPDAVAQGDTEEDMMGVDYSKLVPMLIKEIQSLRARVADLES